MFLYLFIDELVQNIIKFNLKFSITGAFTLMSFWIYINIVNTLFPTTLFIFNMFTQYHVGLKSSPTLVVMKILLSYKSEIYVFKAAEFI